jgi:hypothetical protein
MQTVPQCAKVVEEPRNVMQIIGVTLILDPVIVPLPVAWQRRFVESPEKVRRKPGESPEQAGPAQAGRFAGSEPGSSHVKPVSDAARRRQQLRNTSGNWFMSFRPGGPRRPGEKPPGGQSFAGRLAAVF